MTDRQFPIMVGYLGTPGPCPSSIPWEAIAPYDGQARVNHQQSLEHLASRGGLSPMEAFLVMTGRTWQGETFTVERQKEACLFLDKIVQGRGELQAKYDAALLQVGDAKKLLEEFTTESRICQAISKDCGGGDSCKCLYCRARSLIFHMDSGTVEKRKEGS